VGERDDMVKLAFVLIAAFVVGCSGSAGGAPAPRTPEPPAPTPTPHPPYAIEVASAKATTKTRVGGDMVITVVLKNTGTVASESTEFQISKIEDYADVVGCTPKCAIDRGFGGGYYLNLPGIPAGKTKTYEVELIPTKVGAAHWDVCVYDDTEFGDQIYCVDGTVTIR
jgi:hypothetical protein